MTKQQRVNERRVYERLQALGIEIDDIDALFRIERTLSRWSEEECNGTIQRDGDNGDGAPRRYWENHLGEHQKGGIIPDRERGALKRLASIMARYPALVYYNQSDPRGCALYVVARVDIKQGEDLDSVYTRGVAVCY